VSIYAVAGATIEAVLLSDTSGQAGTYRVSILDTPSGSYFLNPTSSGVTEKPTGSGVYGWSGTAPNAVGQYSIIWDSGTTAGVVAIEDLLITANGTQPVPASGNDLTTRGAVQTFLESTDSSRNDAIDAAISNASAAITRYCSREFVPTASAARTFTVDPTSTRGPLGAYLVDLAPYDLRTITTAHLHYGTGDQVALASADYLLRPENGTGGTYTDLLIRKSANVRTGDRYADYGTAELRVAGGWGFAAVPTDVAYACVLTVASWLRRDVAALEAGLDDPRMMLPDQPMGRRIPGPALAMLTPFRRVPV
jgi:hypothetical protein